MVVCKFLTTEKYPAVDVQRFEPQLVSVSIMTERTIRCSRGLNRSAVDCVKSRGILEGIARMAAIVVLQHLRSFGPSAWEVLQCLRYAFCT